MTVTQRIDVERTTSDRTWIDHEQVQSANFETLNGILVVWVRHFRNDDAVMQRAFRKECTKDKERYGDHT